MKRNRIAKPMRAAGEPTEYEKQEKQLSPQLLAEWVRRNYTRVYIPTEVLERLGLDTLTS